MDQKKWYLMAFVATRLVLATSLRLMFPFLPAIARGMGVSLEAAALLVTFRSALGVTGPALGSVADAWGHRTGITVGLVTFVLGTIPIAIWPIYPVVLVGVIISGIGNIIADSSIYAYVGDRFPYRQRARAIAVVEAGWSGAFLVGIPAVGWLISRSTWNTAYLWLAVFGGLLLMVLHQLLPRDKSKRQTGEPPWKNLQLVMRYPRAWVGPLFSMLILTAHQFISIVYGAWMEEAFGLRIEELGAASSVLGLAGIAGVGLVFLFSDRIGKRLAVGLGVVVTTASGLALPLLSDSLIGALIALFCFFLSFEFALTTSISLLTELIPEARATIMAANVAAVAIGDALGAAAGPWLFRRGLSTNVLTAAVFNAIGVVLLVTLIRAKQPRQQPEGMAA
jgi:predicted MFS family arabinose efflux permease